jgi:Tfp pilus assembly protein PilF
MSLLISILLIVVGGVLEGVRRLSNEWSFLNSLIAKIPYHNAVMITITIICVVLGIAYQLKTEVEKRIYSVIVVPEFTDVSPGYNKKAILKIVNNQDYPIYQIDLQVTVEEGDLSVDNVKLDLKEKSKITSNIGGLAVSHDVIRMGMVTTEGKREDHLIIYDVDAHSTKELNIEVDASKFKTKSRVHFQIVRSDKSPADVVSFDPFIFCKSNEGSFENYHETSKTMLGQKRYKEAIICCEKAIGKDPKSGKVHSNMGVAYLFLSEIDKAIREFETAISLDPMLSKAYLNLSGLLMNQGKYQDAIERLKTAFELNGSDQAEILVLWGRCLGLIGDKDAATEKFIKSLELTENAGEAYFYWGMLLKNHNECAEAMSKFQKSVEYEHPLKLDAFGMWGGCLENMENYKEAGQKYQKIIELAPNSEQAQRSKRSLEVLKQKTPA